MLTYRTRSYAKDAPGLAPPEAGGRESVSVSASVSDAACPRLTIPVVAGVGRATTLLSAFDAALHACGALNYNLVPLSSVIPPASTVAAGERYVPTSDEHGDRLYVVKAEARSNRPGEVVGAGVGWYQWGDGRGVFVEHEAVGPTRHAVASELNERICWSLRDLCAHRGVPFADTRVRSRVVCAEVEDDPTSALVLAVFRSEAWA